MEVSRLDHTTNLCRSAPGLYESEMDYDGLLEAIESESRDEVKSQASYDSTVYFPSAAPYREHGCTYCADSGKHITWRPEEPFLRTHPIHVDGCCVGVQGEYANMDNQNTGLIWDTKTAQTPKTELSEENHTGYHACQHPERLTESNAFSRAAMGSLYAPQNVYNSIDGLENSVMIPSDDVVVGDSVGNGYGTTEGRVAHLNQNMKMVDSRGCMMHPGADRHNSYQESSEPTTNDSESAEDLCSLQTKDKLKKGRGKGRNYVPYRLRDGVHMGFQNFSEFLEWKGTQPLLNHIKTRSLPKDKRRRNLVTFLECKYNRRYPVYEKCPYGVKAIESSSAGTVMLFETEEKHYHAQLREKRRGMDNEDRIVVDNLINQGCDAGYIRRYMLRVDKDIKLHKIRSRINYLVQNIRRRTNMVNHCSQIGENNVICTSSMGGNTSTYPCAVDHPARDVNRLHESHFTNRIPFERGPHMIQFDHPGDQSARRLDYYVRPEFTSVNLDYQEDLMRSEYYLDSNDFMLNASTMGLPSSDIYMNSALFTSGEYCDHEARAAQENNVAFRFAAEYP